jgi:hypothetical protein
VDEEYDKLNVLELRVVELKITLVPLPLYPILFTSVV